MSVSEDLIEKLQAYFDRKPQESIVMDGANSYCSPELFEFMKQCNTEMMNEDGIDQSKREIPFSIYDCDTMDGHQFESVCAWLLESVGFQNVRVTKGSGDQGIDILAEVGDILYGIQCKRYNNPIGNKAVQEVFAGAAYYNCNQEIVMTNSFFTDSAIQLANKTGVKLWDRSVLEKIITDSGGVPAHIAALYKPFYLPDSYGFTKKYEEDTPDELLIDAIDVVVETGMASPSMLQRRLKIGYTRAAKLIDDMETIGIISGFMGAKPRNLFITKEQWKGLKNTFQSQ